MSYYDIYRREGVGDYKLMEASNYGELVYWIPRLLRKYPLSTFKAFGPDPGNLPHSRWIPFEELIQRCLTARTLTEIDLMERAL